MDVADSEYIALTAGVGFVDCGDRTQIEITGDDRATLLHNLTTNSIRTIQPGEGCETFALDVRGHIVGHFFVFCAPHALIVETVPGQAERLVNHFEKYHIREKVEFHDRTAKWGELLLAGRDGAGVIARMFGSVPEQRLEHREVVHAGQHLWLRRVDLAAPESFLIAGPREAIGPLAAELTRGGAMQCGPSALEALRIESGFPWFGPDISDKNLPQEVGRDPLAINFNKGCYLGQETVARIDALGHVNRTLVGVRFSGDEVPSPGTELWTETTDDKPVGAVTSSTFSPRLAAPLGLAYLRRGQNSPGTKLRWSDGNAEVVAFPLAPDVR